MSWCLNREIGESGDGGADQSSRWMAHFSYACARYTAWLLVLLLVYAMLPGAVHAKPTLLLNIKSSDSAPWGSEAAAQSMSQLAASGAQGGMVVAFAWQADIHADHLQVGAGSDDSHLRLALRQVRATGMDAVLKLHVWVPSAWAGNIDPDGSATRASWFADYTHLAVHLAQLAQQEHVKAFVIANELRTLQDDPHWPALILAVRQHYTGKILYAADSVEQAERFQYWSLLDAVGTNLYPALPENQEERRQRMQEWAQRVADLSRRTHKPVWVTEVGIRSARGSLEKPWESPEERQAQTDLDLQQHILAEWLQVLGAVKPSIRVVAIWCWYTDPDAGGLTDTDFTIQNKPAQQLLEGGCCQLQ